ncbi:hypothetical protein [Fimbriiglobus ruber]|uniref:Uncharacterized protein n=1 Tax=Fimbriiglobus ruber TaxID=1908690 RepID=A0A225DKC7_9BACT|nr:hypothetical protein [Fimbriiglobus ruber]OWK37649.1 hypothetical protein FRUB_06769 [Fimbriiglobus ruber]
MNPLSPRHSVVLVAGLSADATYRVADRANFPTAEAAVFLDGGRSRQFLVTRPKSAADAPAATNRAK